MRDKLFLGGAMLNKSLAVMVFLFSANFAYSIEPNWQTLPITGGKVNSLAYAPDKSRYLLASGAQRVFKTTDGGDTWTPVLNAVKPVALAFSPNTKGRAYVSGSYANAFYRTDDYGDHWVLVSSATMEELMLTKSNFKFDVALAVDPSNENIIYGASNEVFPPGDNGNEYPAILKSIDGGVNWVGFTDSVFPPNVSTDAVITAFVQPASGKLIFSVNNGYGQKGGIFYSDNSGSNWSPATLNVVDSSARAINSLAIDPSHPGTLYAGGKVILKSKDYGQTWNPLANQPPYPNGDSIYGITIKDVGDIVACDSSNCYESADDGGTWSPGAAVDKTLSTGVRGPLVYSSLNSAIYLAGAYSAGGIYRLPNADLTNPFEPINKGLYNVEFLSLLHDPVKTNVIYAANQSDFFVSSDSGTSWATTHPTSDGKRSGAFAMLTDTDGTLYAGIGKVLRKSPDSGNKWEDVYDFTSLNIGNIMALAFDPNDHNTMYMGTGGTENPSADAGFYKSTNKGQNWSRISLKDGTDEVKTVSRIAVSTKDANVIYAVCNPVDNDNAYLYKTADGGTTWNRLSKPDEGGYIYSLALDPDYDGTVYVANDWYVYKSANSGATWTAIFDDHTKGSVKSFIATHPAGGARAFYMGLDDSVYTSINEGAKWTLIGSGFNGVKALAQGSLYVGTSDGLYKSEIASSRTSSMADTILVSTMSSGGTVKVTIPPGAFSEGTGVMVTPYIGALATTGEVKPTSVGINVQTSLPAQPASAVTLTFKYADADIAGLDENKLAVARVNDDGSYTMLASVVVSTDNTVTAETTHFSNFALVQYTPSASSSVAAPIAYPIPYDPSRHPGGMTIDKLLPGSEAKIFTITGQLVRKLTADGSGKAVWNGKNEAGRTVASGIYLAVVKDAAGKTRRLKLALEK